MTRYPQVLINVGGVARDRLNSNKKVQEAITVVEKSLGNKGRVLLRASGTEPLIRVMIEAEDSAAATKFAESLAALVKSELAL
jgi:phosphoglucosamine mutase